MPHRSVFAVFIIALSLCSLLPTVSNAGVCEEAKVQAATAVIKEIMEIPECAIPPSLLACAHGIVIFPDLLKAGFIFGARYGVGVMLVRNEDGRWGDPVFFRLIGGSFGWQIGAQSTDVILVLKSIRSLDLMCGGKFTLGGDASIAAGPVGRQAEADTDVLLRAENPLPTPEAGVCSLDFRSKAQQFRWTTAPHRLSITPRGCCLRTF